MILNRFAAVGLAAGVMSMIGTAFAADDPIETIVVTGTKFNTDAAPAKASLDTVEPQTIINRSYIENFLPPTADYVTVLSIAASMTGNDPNGPGLPLWAAYKPGGGGQVMQLGKQTAVQGEQHRDRYEFFDVLYRKAAVP